MKTIENDVLEHSENVLDRIKNKHKYNKYPKAKIGDLIRDWNGAIGLVIRIKEPELNNVAASTRMLVNYAKETQTIWYDLANHGQYSIVNRGKDEDHD
tara:strand:+ start:142 stop:435 length:294 start_codon:yes stop_codon:yes gene_type:complete